MIDLISSQARGSCWERINPMLRETRSTRKTWRVEIFPARFPANFANKGYITVDFMIKNIGNIGPAIKHSHWSILLICALGCLGLVINRYINFVG